MVTAQEMKALRKQAQAIANNPSEFATQFIRIYDKRRRLVPLRHTHAQAHYLANRTPRDLILKARQLGFSTMIQAEVFRIVTTRPTSALTMADTDENTMKLRRMQETFYEKLPIKFSPPERSEANASITTYPKIGSKLAIATAGGRSSGRADTYTLLHGSEVAYWRNADWVIAGALQAIPNIPETWVVFESTANGARGWFYDECMRAAKGESNWRLHFYAWWWDAEYQMPLEVGEVLKYTDEEEYLAHKHNLTPQQIKWRRSKQNDLKELFQQEYPEDVLSAFLTSGGGVFQRFHAALYKPIESQALAGHRYVAGIDWGRDNDYTAVSVWDADEYREVELFRVRHTSFESIVSQIVELCKKWRIQLIKPERNSIGAVAIDMLASGLDTIGRYPDGTYPQIASFTTTNKSKDDAIQAFKRGLEGGAKLVDDETGTDELQAYAQTQSASGLWTYSAPSGMHDDTVIARLLGHLACFSYR